MARATELTEALQASIDRTPFARAVGMRVTSCAAGVAEAELPQSERTAVSRDDASVHPLALVGFLDQLSSHAVASLAVDVAGMSTIELRVDFTGGPIVGAVRGRATSVSSSGGARLVTATATDAMGAEVATCTAWFTLGSYPGQKPASNEPSAPRADDWFADLQGPFENLIGLRRSAAGAVLAADVFAAIGWEGLPALHGGTVGAVLGLACQQLLAAQGRSDLRLASLSISYLRAGGAHGLEAVAECARPGRRAARVTARCFHAAGPDVGVAQALFVPVEACG